MKPSQKIILLFGGVREMARTLGIPATTIQYWWEEGRIPGKRQQGILNSAQTLGIELSYSDFFEPQNPISTRKRRQPVSGSDGECKANI